MTPHHHPPSAQEETLPVGRLRPQPWMLMPETARLLEALTPRDGKGEAIKALAPRFVGGCVRDALANRPVVDIDLATPLKPEVVVDMLRAAGIEVVPTGISHGTVTAVVSGRHFEITTLRVDVMTFGRDAEVKFTDDWKTDAARRDFTINAMSCDAAGNVYDYFGGISDLRQGIVRFVGIAEKRIREDVLRILRYYRFLAHFGRGVPDPGALYSCKAAAPSLRKLSGERIRQELLRLLEAPRAAEVWRFMLQGGVMTHVLPEATDWARLQRLIALEARFDQPPYPLRRLAATLVVTPEGLKPAVQSLRLSSRQATQLFSMVKYERSITSATAPAEMRRLVYHHGNETALSLLLLAAARDGDNDVGLPFVEGFYDIATGFRAPAFPVRGADVIGMGVAAGEVVGQALAQAEAWWLAQDMRPGRDECLDFLRQRLAVLKDW